VHYTQLITKSWQETLRSRTKFSTHLGHWVVVDVDDLIQVLNDDAGDVLQLPEVELPVRRYKSTE